MKRSRRHIVNEQGGKNDRIKRLSSKSLEFCSVIGLGKKVNQTACFPEDNFSVVPLKTSREESPCQDSQQCRTSACALQESDFQFTTPLTPTPGSAVSSLFLSLILALPSPLQANLALSSFSFFSHPLSSSVLLLTFYDRQFFYIWYKAMLILWLFFVLGSQKIIKPELNFCSSFLLCEIETTLVLGWQWKWTYLGFMDLYQNRISRDGHLSLNWNSKNNTERFNF